MEDFRAAAASRAVLAASTCCLACLAVSSGLVVLRTIRIVGIHKRLVGALLGISSSLDRVIERSAFGIGGSLLSGGPLCRCILGGLRLCGSLRIVIELLLGRIQGLVPLGFGVTRRVARVIGCGPGRTLPAPRIVEVVGRGDIRRIGRAVCRSHALLCVCDRQVFGASRGAALSGIFGAGGGALFCDGDGLPLGFEPELPDEELDEELDPWSGRSGLGGGGSKAPPLLASIEPPPGVRRLAALWAWRLARMLDPGARPPTMRSNENAPSETAPMPHAARRATTAAASPIDASRACDQLRRPATVRHRIHAWARRVTGNNTFQTAGRVMKACSPAVWGHPPTTNHNTDGARMTSQVMTAGRRSATRR